MCESSLGCHAMRRETFFYSSSATARPTYIHTHIHTYILASFKMINESVLVESEYLRLVPYVKGFTPTYHRWMCDPELLALTESEPLTLEEELENQASWLHATDKLTFLLLAPSTADATTDAAAGASSQIPFSLEPLSTAGVAPCGAAASSLMRSGEWFVMAPSSASSAEEANSSRSASPLPIRFMPRTRRSLLTGKDCGADPLGFPIQPRPQRFVAIGDCNLFLLENEEEDLPGSRVFEIEVMVAEVSYRRRGLAAEAVRLLMTYAINILGATRFVAKILEDNAGSIRLFTEVLGFECFKEVKVFHEVHLHRRVQSFLAGGGSQILSDRAEERVVLAPYDAEAHAEVDIISIQPGV